MIIITIIIDRLLCIFITSEYIASSSTYDHCQGRWVCSGEQVRLRVGRCIQYRDAKTGRTEYYHNIVDLDRDLGFLDSTGR